MLHTYTHNNMRVLFYVTQINTYALLSDVTVVSTNICMYSKLEALRINSGTKKITILLT